jgi:hypothetical protein
MADLAKAMALLGECYGDIDAFGEKILSSYGTDGRLLQDYSFHPGQKRLTQAHNIIVLCTAGNRSGKTSGIAKKHIYYCLYKIGLDHLLWEDPERWVAEPYQSLNASFEYNTAMKVFNFIDKLSRNNALFKEGECFIKKIRLKDNSIVWFNGAVTHFSSLDDKGKHIEGEGYHLVSIDEIGYEQSLEDVYMSVIQPRTLDTNGITILAGTPKETQDPWVDQLYERAKTDKEVDYVTISTEDNRYIPLKQIEAMRERYKDYPALLQMVFYGKLIPSSGRSLTGAQINNAVDKTLPFDARDRVGEPTKGVPIMYGTTAKEEGHKYVSFWDIAMETDWSVGITLDVTSLPFFVKNMTRVNRSVITGWNELFDLMIKEHRRYGCVQHYDATGQLGGKLSDDLKKLAFEQNLSPSWSHPMMIIGDKGRKKSGQIGKEELINCLTLAFSWKQPVDGEDTGVWGKVRIPNIVQLKKELAQYHPDDKKIKETDSVIALAGAIAVAPDPTRHLRSGYSQRLGVSTPKTYIRTRS